MNIGIDIDGVLMDDDTYRCNDSPEVLKEIAKFTKVLCFDNRYNTNLEYNNMTRVFSWYDIYMKIKELVK